MEDGYFNRRTGQGNHIEIARETRSFGAILLVAQVNNGGAYVY